MAKICFFCDKKIVGKYHIHHKDHDHSNNDPSNRVTAHPGCHSSYHNSLREWSEESREKVRLTRLGAKHSEETKKKMSETRKGRPGRILSAETKAKISAARMGQNIGNKFAAKKEAS